MSNNLFSNLSNIGQTISSGFNSLQKQAGSLLGGLNNSLTPKTGFSSGKSVKQKYNDVTYKVELWLDNAGDLSKVAKNVYPINPAAVMNLSINNTLNDWAAKGSITFMYMPEDAPSSQELSLAQKIKTFISGAKENAETLNSFQFRGDGFDLLRVVMTPIVKTDETATGSALSIPNNDPKWTLSYLFSIYDIEDINDIPGMKGPIASYMKAIKLFFHDVRYQILRTTNLEYSTTLSPEADFATNGAQEGCVLTGNAILEVWNQSVGDPEKGGSLEFVQTKGPDWDEGSGKIFYTSPAAYSALEDIEYLFSHHTSKEPLEGVENELYDMCILGTKRPNTPEFLEELTITPIKKLFKKSTEGNQPGELQLEHFFVTSHTQNEKNANAKYKAPLSKDSSSNRDLKTFKYGQIISYSFIDMSPEINSTMFATAPIYSVDVGQRRFQVKFKNNDVLTARKAITENYIEPLYKETSTSEELFIPTIHKTKQSYNIFPKFSLNGDDTLYGKILRQKNGLHDLMYTGLFQNTCICFKTFGLSLRNVGTFIAIDKTGGSRDNDFNNKLYGQWFVTRIDHVFEAGSYMNAIYAVKIHRFKNPNLKFETTI